MQGCQETDTMNIDDAIDYGPLEAFLGVWKGDKGLDVTPDPKGEEINPFHETITFTAIGDATNAEEQVLAAVHYRQIVKRKSNDEVFHDATGYWMWDGKAGTLMHSLAIPRASACSRSARSTAERPRIRSSSRSLPRSMTARSSSRRSCARTPGPRRSPTASP
ncbi:MAG: hypothetical protein Fur0037_03070 [Planctomycetota bacterium]